MSMQSRKVQEHLAHLKRLGIIAPEQQDPRQLWLIVVMHPGDGHSGEVFVTHGKNYDKFKTRKGFEVIAHGWDRQALTGAARKLTVTLGTNYQSQFSAARKAASAAPPPLVEDPDTGAPTGSADTIDVADELDIDPTKPN